MALIVVPQVAELQAIAGAFQQVRWPWLAAAATASAVTYPMAAAEIAGAAGRRLPPGQAALAEIASAVAAVAAPSGIGGASIVIRYLERRGLTRADSIAAVTLANAAGFLIHVILLTIAGTFLARARVQAMGMPPRWGVLLAVIVVATLAAITLWSPFGGHLPGPIRQAARSLVATARQTIRRLAALGKHPFQTAVLVAGGVGITTGYVLALWYSLRTVGAQPPLTVAAVAYLAGSAVGAASPTPGGLGALDAALTGILIHFNVTSGQAVAGVLVFRLVTYWLPVLPGAAAVAVLRRRGAL
jgi:undecaprenyl-diphosphatase